MKGTPKKSEANFVERSGQWAQYERDDSRSKVNGNRRRKSFRRLLRSENLKK